MQIESLPASSVSHYCCIITRRGRFSFRYTSASLPRRVFGAFRCAKNSHRIWNANREDWVGATERRPRVKNSRRNWNATEKIELEPRDKVHSPCCARSLRGISCDCVDFFLVDVLLYVHSNRRLIRDGEPRTATSTFTQLLNSVVISSTPGLCSLLQNLSFLLRAFSLQLHSSGAV